MRRFWYGHCYMPLYRIFAFLFPPYIPRGFDHMTDDVLNLPRAPFFVVWPQQWLRSLRVWRMRSALRKKSWLLS